MKKSIFYTLAFILFTISLNTFAQKQMKIMTAGEIVLVPEISGVIEYADSELKIAAANMGPQSTTTTIDIKVDDKILFVNGNRVKTLDDFNKHYEGSEIGSEVKLGIKRGDERFIVAFTKADPSKFKHKVMRMEAGDKSEEEIQKTIKKKKEGSPE